MDYYNNNMKVHIVPGSEKKGFSPILRNPLSKHVLESQKFAEIKTVYEIFIRAVKLVPNDPYLGYRPYNYKAQNYGKYVFLTYKEVYDRASNFASGIVNMLKQVAISRNESADGVLSRNWPVGIYSINRLEWGLTDRALGTQSLHSVALYDTLGESSIEYILNHTELRVLVCSIDKISKILKLADRAPHLRIIISVDNFDTYSTEKAPTHLQINNHSIEILKNWAKSKDIILTDIGSVENDGSLNKLPDVPPKANDIYTILYTSGTTGHPKGVVSTHRNFSYAAAAIYTARHDLINVPSVVSFLPLAHCYGRNIENFITLYLGKIGYFSASIERLVEDNNSLNPSVFSGVPRLLQKFYDVLASKTLNAQGHIGEMTRRGMREKIQNFQDGKGLDHALWDPLIFNKTKAFLSKNVEIISTGSAPLSPHVNDFLRIALKSNISDGYGLTETASMGTCQAGNDTSSNNSGIPYVGTEIRLRDVPEMEYLVTDKPYPRGEVLIRCPANFREYLKEPEKTAETMLEDGWFASGDIGIINQDGSLSIIDRKKSLFKLSQGEYISPEKVENVISKNDLIAQTFVHGYSTKDFVVGVVVPDPAIFTPWANKKINTEGFTFDKLCNNPQVNSALVGELRKFCRESGLHGFEIPKCLYIEATPFDIETNGLLTPTLKLKRFDAAKHYKSTIDKLYEQN